MSKAVARLEARLGERLIHRNSRRFALTDAGRVLSVRAARILAEGEAAEADASACGNRPRGRVRLAAPMSFGVRHVAPLLPEFLAANPDVVVDLRLDDRVVDLIDEGIDVALRIAAMADSSLIARQLCPVRRFVVGSPGYFATRGRPSHPSDLARHACLTYTYLPSGDSWRFTGPGGEAVAVDVTGPFSANNADAFAPALEGGLGIAMQPDFLVADALADDRLERVLADWQAPPLGVSLVSLPGGPRPARVTALMDFLVERMANGRSEHARAA